MSVEIIYYLDVTSSWCYWAEPAWAELRERYAGKPVEFSWRIALLDETALPTSKAQLEWFYRRSGMIVRSPFPLNSGWYEGRQKEYLLPNAVAEAAKDFGVTDDRVRLAIASAALRDGQRILSAKICAAVAAKAASLDAKKLLARAQSAEVEKRVRAATAEFHALQVTQRPTFVLTNNIGDRAVFLRPGQSRARGRGDLTLCWRTPPHTPVTRRITEIRRRTNDCQPPLRTFSFFSSSSAWRDLRALTSCFSNCATASKSPLAAAAARSSLRKISRSAILAEYRESNSASCFFCSAVNLTTGADLLKRSIASS